LAISGGDTLGFAAAAAVCVGALAAFVALESGVAMLAGGKMRFESSIVVAVADGQMSPLVAPMLGQRRSGVNKCFAELERAALDKICRALRYNARPLRQ
jgi:hypothetical protein